MILTTHLVHLPEDEATDLKHEVRSYKTNTKLKFKF